MSKVGITKAQAESYLARDTQYQAAFKAMRDAAVQKQSADYAASENAMLLSRQQEAGSREPAFDFREASIASRQAEDARAAAAIQRQNELGPQFRPIDPVAEAQAAEARLRTKNSLEIALLGPFGVTGAAVRALGGDEYHVAVANELGAATFGLAGALAGIPVRGPIDIGTVSYNNVNATNYATEAFAEFKARGNTEIMLGARAGGVEFGVDPILSGGPLRELTNGNVKISTKGIDVVENNVSRFGDDPANQLMIDRLRGISNGEIDGTVADYNFYTHELREFTRVRGLGYEAGTLPGDVYYNAHSATLREYGIQPQNYEQALRALYHPDAILLMEGP